MIRDAIGIDKMKNHFKTRYSLAFVLGCTTIIGGCGGGGGSIPITGSKMFFVSTESGIAQLYFSNLDGSGKRTILDSIFSDTDLATAPGTGQIYFLRTNGVDTDIFCTDNNGSNVTQITFDGGQKSELQIEPLGTKLAFIAGPLGNQSLVTISKSGSNRQTLIAGATAISQPRFNSNSSQILYLKQSPQFNIFTINTNGTAEFQVTTAASNITSANFNEFGSQIVFAQDISGQSEILIIDSNGQNQQILTTGTNANTFPIFFDNSQKIAFSTFQSGDDEIAIMDTDGSNIQILTDNGVDDNKITLSADKQLFIWTRGTLPNTSIVSSNTNGTNQVPIHFNSGTKSNYVIP